MMIRNNNWFLSMYSTKELIDILFDYYKDVHGVGYGGLALERCSVVNELEKLDKLAAKHPTAA